MPKKQFSARLPDRTFQQIEDLQAKLGMTKVQVMMLAVERLAKQELKRKKESE